MLVAERSRTSRDLHDDLGASLTDLSMLSELAAEDNHDEQLHSSFSQVSVKAKRVVGTLDEIVWASNPTQDSLRSPIEYFAFSGREFLKAARTRLRTDLPREIPDVAIGPRRRHNIALVTREAINNAIKHAQPQSIFLHITIEDGTLTIRIEDDGTGFSVDEAVAGEGLTNLHGRMRNCSGSCSIESSRSEGTKVTLTLPLPPVTLS